MRFWHVWSLVFWLFALFTGLLAIASGHGGWFIPPLLCALVASWAGEKAIQLDRYPHTYPDEEFE